MPEKTNSEREKPRTNRPVTLDELWTEKDLCERVGVRMGKGHSTVLSNWIKGGLKCVEISGRRFFWEHDIIEYLVSRQSRQQG